MRLRPLEVRFQKRRRGKHRIRMLRVDDAPQHERALTAAAAEHLQRQDGRGISDRKGAPAVFVDDALGVLRFVHADVLLRFHPHVDERQRQKVLDAHGLQLRDGSQLSDARCVVHCKRKQRVGQRLVELADVLDDVDEVRSCAPHFVSQPVRSIAAAALPAFSPVRQWHLAQLNVRQAWTLSAGAGVVVAVLDDGVDVDHGNLRNALAVQPDPTEERDRFGRDFSFVDDDPRHFDPRPKQFAGVHHELATNDIHGTPCAGLIAARGMLHVGGQRPTVGVAPQCRVLPVRVFSAGSFIADARVADAVTYAGRVSDVVSMSFVYSASNDLQAALDDAAATGRQGRGCVFVGAVGNQGLNGFVPWPASSPHVIGVGACTHHGQRAMYSNTGDGLDVYAPSSTDAEGQDHGIATCDVSHPQRGFAVSAAGQDGLHTTSFSGTSAAAPQVAAIAALVRAFRPQLQADQVKQAVVRGVDAIAAHGADRANAFQALLAAREWD